MPLVSHLALDRCVYALLLVSFCFFNVFSQCPQTFNYTGGPQDFVVPDGVTEIDIKIWGAGGAGASVNHSTIGGAGGFVSGKLTVIPGQTYTVIVGQGGTMGGTSYTYGGGGYSLNPNGAGGRGGGRSAIRLGTTELATAGGGGGGAWPNAPGCGTNRAGAGGPVGGSASGSTGGGTGATVSAPGLGDTTPPGTASDGEDGQMFLGGRGGSDATAAGNGGGGGGGGGGYYGGGGGQGGYSCCTCSSVQESDGGGGSNYTGGLTTTLENLGGTNDSPPMQSDPDWSDRVGIGGSGSGANQTGGHGRVVISFPVGDEICGNGEDDDCDGLVDCADQDCNSNINSITFDQATIPYLAPGIVNQDISDFLGLPAGSVIMETSTLYTDADSDFVVGRDALTEWTFSGTEMVLLTVTHDSNLQDGNFDGLVALDGQSYTLQTSLPAGWSENNIGGIYSVVGGTGGSLGEDLVWESDGFVSNVRIVTDDNLTPLSKYSITISVYIPKEEICGNGEDDDCDGFVDCDDSDCSMAMTMREEFSFTGSDQFFTVPDNVSKLTVKAWGAAGGIENGVNPNSAGTKSGTGGYTEGMISVTPGQQYLIVVGEGGRGQADPAYMAYGGAGSDFMDGGGGGLSGIFDAASFANATSTNALLVAGGGGGAATANAADIRSGTNGNGANAGGSNLDLIGQSDSNGNTGLASGGGGYQGGQVTNGIANGGTGFVQGDMGMVMASDESILLPPNTMDSDYIAGVGEAVEWQNTVGGSDGGSGHLVIYYSNDIPCECTNSCCTEASISLQKLVLQACPDNMLLDLKVFNGPEGDIPLGTPITFYEGNPTITGATKLNTYMLMQDIPAGANVRINDIDIGICMNSGKDIYAILGDAGNANIPLDLSTDITNDVYEDCDYSNNMASIELKITCGEYTTITQN